MPNTDQLDSFVQAEREWNSAALEAPKVSSSWSKQVKKTVYTLNVGDYAPEICALTYPLMQAYARKIGADFHVIRERKFPGWPAVYEKLQIHELGREHGNDWNIYIDSDALINPEMFDVTEHLNKNTICHNGTDMAGIRWKYDHYFRRDGRHIGSCNWFTIASDWCLDLWRPLEDLTLEQAVENINITVGERNCGHCRPEHLIDDYTLSRNIARFGLKVQTVMELCGKLGWHPPGGGPVSPFLFHKYTISNEQKAQEMLMILSTPLGQPSPAGAGWGLLTPEGAARYQKIWGKRARPAKEVPVAPGSHIQGWMTAEELRWLYETGKTMDSIVEIGSWKGRSTFALCSSECPRVYAVDHFQGSSEHQQEFGFGEGWSPFPEFQHNILDRFSNAILKRMSSAEAAKDFEDASVDMVFIDGAHEYDAVFQDVALWAPKARRIVSGHDQEYESVRRACQDYFKRPPDEVVGNVWVYRL